MRLIELFIHRPMAAIVLHLIVLLIGVRAVQSLPIVWYPMFELSSLVVTTTYVGAPAETVRGFITTPIEQAISSVPGLDYVESKSIAGTSTVTARLKLGQDSSRALSEIGNRLDQIRTDLPEDAEPPRVEVQRTDKPWATFYLGFSSPTLDYADLSEYVIRDVQPIFAGIPGVQRVAPMGATQRAMRVWLDVPRMAAFGLDASDISESLRRNNYVAAVGQVKGDEMAVNLQADTSLTSAEEFRNLVVQKTEGGIVRLSDVARVELGAEDLTTDTRIGKERAVYLEIWPLPGVDELSIDSELQRRLEALKSSLPAGVEVKVAYNATSYMRDSLVEISKTLTETILIVALVVFLFLGSLRSALVPLIAVPLSLVGTAAIMSALGMSLNILTILAIVLSIGLVVDDAIVVVESVQRRVREGAEQREAALQSIRMLLTPIIAMTITLATVYIPIGFLSGLSGVLLREFAFTLACAVSVSGIVAITLSPVMSAWAIPKGGFDGKFARASNRLIEQLTNTYARLLDVTLRHRPQMLTIVVFLVLLVPFLFSGSSRELAPVEDQNEIDFILTGGPSATIEYMGERHIDEIVDKLKPLKGVDFVWMFSSATIGFAGVMLVDWHDRNFGAPDLMPEAYAAMKTIPGLQLFPLLPSALPGGGWYDVEMVLAGSATAEQMQSYAAQLMAAAGKSGKFLFTDTDLKIDMPISRIEIDRERVADLDLDLATVGRTLGAMTGGDYVNRFDYEGRPYKVVPQLGRDARVSSEQLLDLRVRTPSGDLVPVSSFASLTQGVEPRALNRFQQMDSFRIQGGAAQGVTKDEALSALEAAAKDILPANFHIDYAGESRQLRQQGNDLVIMGGLGLALIYLVLALQLGGFRDPFVVLLGSVPLAISGALIFPFFNVTTINLYSQIGLLTLIGLTAKNAILIVDFANRLRDQGLSRVEAVRQAAVERLRPVLMTTIATMCGHAPLAFVTGPGSAARNSIGIVLIAGMAIGTLFTLFLLPSVYAVLAARRDRPTEEPLPAHA